ncbi:hypothetical protein J6590_087422 [Homalodisca vitripennis]|nr:hypothetical protein J6590_087422 [Homalodisca vitripennis]
MRLRWLPILCHQWLTNSGDEHKVADESRQRQTLQWSVNFSPEKEAYDMDVASLAPECSVFIFLLWEQ